MEARLSACVFKKVKEKDRVLIHTDQYSNYTCNSNRGLRKKLNHHFCLLFKEEELSLMPKRLLFVVLVQRNPAQQNTGNSTCLKYH